MQTSSVCLRRQLPRRGSREKANCAERFYREKNRERTKDSRGVGKGKAGKRLVRRLEQTSSVCLRRQLPRRGSRERANCAERFYREENRERNERQPRRWIGQSGERVGAAVGADLFSLLAQTASPKGEAGKAGTIPRRAGIKIDEVYTHIRLRIRGNRFCKAIL